MKEGASVAMLGEIANELLISTGHYSRFLRKANTSRIDNCQIIAKDLKDFYTTLRIKERKTLSHST